MTSEQCPECNTPLFRVKGQLMCPKCNKLVVVIKEGEDEDTLVAFSILESLEKTLLLKLQESDRCLQETKSLEKAKELGSQLNVWLEAIERLKAVQKNFHLSRTS